MFSFVFFFLLTRLCIQFPGPVQLFVVGVFFFLSSSSCSFHRKFALRHAIIISSPLKSGNPDPSSPAALLLMTVPGAVIFPVQKPAAPVVGWHVCQITFSVFNCDSSVYKWQKNRVGKGAPPTPRFRAEMPNLAFFVCVCGSAKLISADIYL